MLKFLQALFFFSPAPMLGNHFTITIHHPGALFADINFYWRVPFQCHFVQASLVNSGSAIEQTSQLTIYAGPAGITTLLIQKDIGLNNVPNIYTVADCHPNRPTGRINEGDKLRILLDHDAGSAVPEDVTIIITLEEG